MPKVSIIIPTYNRADLLPRAIGSVINQTYKNWELIIVDDGSTDNSKEVISGYLKSEIRIKYLFELNSGGASAPRNLGISKASGEYITFLDSDDEYLPTNLERHIKIHAEHPEIGMSGSNMFIDNDKSRKIFFPNSFSTGKLSTDWTLTSGFSSNTMFFNREFLNRVGKFDESLRYLEDMDMTIRSACAGNIFLIDEPLVVCHESTTSLTRSPDYTQKSDSFAPFFKKHFKDYERYNRLSLYYFQWGYFNCSVMGNFRLGKKYFRQSLNYPDKKKKIYFFYYIASSLGRNFWNFSLKLYRIYGLILKKIKYFNWK